LSTRLKYASGFDIQEEISDEDAIKVMTVLTSKGMEFSVVFIIDTIERKLLL
jgi:ATP-dependent exoDNAse (exonuclease V) beta subunit